MTTTLSINVWRLLPKKN